MTNLLPDIVDGQIFTPAEKRRKILVLKKKYDDFQKDNSEELNNLGHNVVTEDFEDSPFADREPIISDEKPCENCGEIIFKTKGTGRQSWIKRRYCTQECRKEALQLRRNEKSI